MLFPCVSAYLRGIFSCRTEKTLHINAVTILPSVRRILAFGSYFCCYGENFGRDAARSSDAGARYFSRPKNLWKALSRTHLQSTRYMPRPPRCAPQPCRLLRALRTPPRRLLPARAARHRHLLAGVSPPTTSTSTATPTSICRLEANPKSLTQYSSGYPKSNCCPQIPQSNLLAPSIPPPSLIPSFID